MQRHICFAAPELLVPRGGKNLMYWFAEILREHGHSVSIHYRSPDYVYPFYQSDVACTYSPQSQDMPLAAGGPGEVAQLADQVPPEGGQPAFGAGPRRSRGASRVRSGEDDHELPRRSRRGAGTGCLRRTPGALVPFRGDAPGKASLLGYLTTSDAVDVAVEAFSDAPHWLVPQMFEPGAFGFVEKKKKQVVFRNRKRPE